MFEFIKTHKVTVILLLVISLFLFKNIFVAFPFSDRTQRNYTGGYDTGISQEMNLKSAPAFERNILPPSSDYAPAPEVSDRKVIRESQMSLQVKNVRTAVDEITDYAQRQDGYMVNTSISNPGEAPTGTITIRIPQTKLNDYLSFLRTLGIKVVWENISGTDVTDEYVDLAARIATLNQTQAKFEEIFTRATEISDIINIQREIINTQSQIDSYKGQQNYLDKSSQMSKITVYLSTDEFSLPYAPSESFRPEVIFKQAVRTLVTLIRKIATLIIWTLVYSVIWVPVLILILYLKRKK